jgi:hypothetical protein
LELREYEARVLKQLEEDFGSDEDPSEEEIAECEENKVTELS